MNISSHQQSCQIKASPIPWSRWCRRLWGRTVLQAATPPFSSSSFWKLVASGQWTKDNSVGLFRNANFTSNLPASITVPSWRFLPKCVFLAGVWPAGESQGRGQSVQPSMCAESAGTSHGTHPKLVPLEGSTIALQVRPSSHSAAAV